MARGAVTLTGDKRFVRAIAHLKRPLLDAINRKGLKRAGTRTQARTRSAYLSGTPLRRITGQLHASIQIGSKRPHETIAIGTNLPQAGPLHFGSPNKNLRPRPFLFPAIEDEIPRFTDIWIEEIEKAVGSVQ